MNLLLLPIAFTLLMATQPPGIPMAAIPAGTFTMGRTDAAPDDTGAADELPRHEVTLDAYAIGVHEVTNGEFAEAVNFALANKLVTAPEFDNAPLKLNGQTLVDFNSQFGALRFAQGHCTVIPRDGQAMDNFPVVMVSWHGAVACCNWQSLAAGLTPCYDLTTWKLSNANGGGFRLPTEAEWERAAACSPKGTHLPYAVPGQNLTATTANFFDWAHALYANPVHLGLKPYLAPAGFFADSRSPTGCFDMSGNVWEWCNDWYAPDTYANGSGQNPQGPESGSARVERGGSWASDAPYCRTAGRNRDTPDFMAYDLGFRVAQSITR